MRRWLLLVVIVFGVLGCKSPPTSGIVTNQEFVAAHEDSRYEQTGQSCAVGAKGVMTCSPTYGYRHYSVPDKWRLQLRDCPQPDECNEGWISVDESTYHRYRVGDRYPEPR